jgi:predicted DNA-binding transcriptional regulator AlpA
MARGEVTGRKPKTGRDVPRLGFRIPEFCRAFGISEDFYYRLQRTGLGPKTIKIGNVTIISDIAADTWRREREAATAATEIASSPTA